LHIEAENPATLEALLDDFRLQNSIVLERQRSVQICVDAGGMPILSDSHLPVPDSMKKTVDALHRMKVIDAATAESLKGAVGFKNVAVYAYDEIDYGIVFSICTRSSSGTAWQDGGTI
jgi:uncharacterized protein YutE (UPF0331/DUF86 family)